MQKNSATTIVSYAILCGGKMNILIEGGDLNPPFIEGTRNIARTYFKELQKSGHNVIVLTKRKGITSKRLHAKEEIVDGIKYYRWSNTIDLFFTYKKIVRAEKIDLIHIFAKGIRPPNYLRLLKHGNNIPIVLSSLGYPFWEEKDKKNFDKFLLLVDKLIITSKTVFENLYGFDTKKIIYLPYGIDIEKFKPMPKKHDTTVILCLRKPSRELIDAYNETAKTAKTCLILSKIESGNEITNYIKETGTKNVSYVDFVDCVEDLINSADIVIELHPKAGFLDCASPPLILLEAMSCGKKIAATDINEVRDIIIDGKNGILMDNTSKGIHAAIRKAISNNKTGLNARQTIVAEYDISKLIKKYELLYAGLIGGR